MSIFTQEDEVPGGGDGSKDGERYFYCANGHGLFLPVRMLKKDNRFDNIDSSSWNSPPPNQGTPEPQSNAASSESALNDFLSHPFAAGWQPPEEVLKQAGLNISPNGLLTFCFLHMFIFLSLCSI